VTKSSTIEKLIKNLFAIYSFASFVLNISTKKTFYNRWWDINRDTHRAKTRMMVGQIACIHGLSLRLKWISLQVSEYRRLDPKSSIVWCSLVVAVRQTNGGICR